MIRRTPAKARSLSHTKKEHQFFLFSFMPRRGLQQETGKERFQSKLSIRIVFQQFDFLRSFIVLAVEMDFLHHFSCCILAKNAFFLRNAVKNKENHFTFKNTKKPDNCCNPANIRLFEISLKNGSKGARTPDLSRVRRTLIPAELCFHAFYYITPKLNCKCFHHKSRK